MEIIKGTNIHEGLVLGTLFIYGVYKEELYCRDDGYDLIMVANNFSPVETMQFRHFNVNALITTEATPTSHTAILSTTMGWPAISGISIKKEWHGKYAIVDGDSGVLIIDPDTETLQNFYVKYKEKSEVKNELLRDFVDRPTVTKSGVKINLYANISIPSDTLKAKENGAEGVGNFKTEFMYLESDDYPIEEELFQIYSRVAFDMRESKVVIRTFDIGTDKIVPYFELDDEENPALGYRAIRIGLDRPEILKTQLRAILRASAWGNVSIMYPMIVSVDEVLEIKCLLNQVMEDLRQNGVAFNENIEQGIMIETPAAVIMSKELAQIVDFFSIGTNDLIQYTLAADRQNPKLAKVYNPYHPAIIRSIEYVVKNAHEYETWVEISGELGLDLSMIKKFVEINIDALAVSPEKILPLRKAICEMD